MFVTKQAKNTYRKGSKNKPKPKAKKKATKRKKNVELSAKWKRRVLLYTWLVVFMPLLVIGAMLLLIPSEEIPDYALLENPQSNQATTVYGLSEKVLGTFYIDNRSNAAYHELPDNLVNALVATEDERFFDHAGVDGWGLLRALAGVATGQKKGGGSTISQQLAKMMFHEMPSRSKWKRVNEKLAEWVIASRIENRYTKKEIISMYFNQFDFLYTGVGIKSASRVYFNKEPKNLSLDECAILVGMAKSPVIYNPKMNPENAKTRRNTVLGQMLKNEYINQEEFDKYSTKEIKLNFNPETQNTGVAPYFRAHVKEELKTILKDNNIQNDEGNPYDLYRDGLKIYTTIDYELQKEAEKAVARHLKGYLQPQFNKDNIRFSHAPFGDEVSKSQRKTILDNAKKQSRRYKLMVENGKSSEEIDKAFNTKVSMTVFDWGSEGYEKTVEMTPNDSIIYYKKVLRVGLVSVDPKSGMVKAWVGGPNFKYFKYDCVSKAKRQVGSTMKPFVYATALERNIITPCETCADVQRCIDVPYGSEIKEWCPGGSNFDGSQLPLFYCLASSHNPCTAYVIDKAGKNNQHVVEFFDKIGLKNNTVQEVPSLGLGVCDFSPLEITAAHCVFTNNGIYNKPITILRVEDRNGKVLFEAEPQSVEAMNAKAAFTTLKMMKGATGVVNPFTGKTGGTAQRLKWDENYGGIKYPIAGKTGTTQFSSDGWFIGHTPDLVTGIWVGNEDRGIHFKSGNLGQGARMAMPIWGYMMKGAYKNRKINLSKKDFDPPNLGEPTQIDCNYSQDDWGIQ